LTEKLIEQAKLAYNSGDYKKALKQFKKFVKLHGKNTHKEDVEYAEQQISKIHEHLELKDYNETKLINADYRVLKKLEQLLGGISIPKFNKKGFFSFYKFWFQVKNNRIIGLSLIDKDLSTHPDNLENLKNLKHLSLKGVPAGKKITSCFI